MTKVSLRNLSLLGLVLMGASAVTAAILPSKTAVRVEGADTGTLLTAATGDGKTCKTDAASDLVRSCNRSNGVTNTTVSPAANSFDAAGGQTVNNTSMTNNGGTSTVQ